MRRPLIHLLIAAAIGSGAAGQGTLWYSWSISDTGDGDGMLGVGENMLLTLVATMDPGATGLARSVFDIGGNADWQTKGAVIRYDNYLDALADDGTLHADNSITGIDAFQLPPAFNPDFDASNPILLYFIEWQPFDHSLMNVEFWTENHVTNDVYVDDFGATVTYDAVPGYGSFYTPGVGTSALLVCAAVKNPRPRRLP